MRAAEPAQEDLSSLETPPVSANTLPQCEEVADNVLGLQILRRSIQDLIIPVKEEKDCLVLKWYKVYSEGSSDLLKSEQAHNHSCRITTTDLLKQT